MSHDRYRCIPVSVDGTVNPIENGQCLVVLISAIPVEQNMAE
jgi:hypothetical protein